MRAFRKRLLNPITSRSELYERVTEIGNNFVQLPNQTEINENDSGLYGKLVTSLFETGPFNAKGPDIPGVTEIKSSEFESKKKKVISICSFRKEDERYALRDAMNKIRYGVTYFEYEKTKDIIVGENQLTKKKVEHTVKGLRHKCVTQYSDLDKVALKETMIVQKKSQGVLEVIADLDVIYKKSEVIFEV